MEQHYEIKVYPNQSSPRLFKNKFLEQLTKTRPGVIIAMYVIISIALGRYYYIFIDRDLSKVAIFFIIGFFSWTLVEYLMHRFLYHKISDASFSTGIQYLFHGIHHEYPSDADRMILPPVPSLIILSVFFGLFYLLMGNIVFVFLPGFIIGYLSYMMIHYCVHTIPPPKKYNFWWKHHNIHHYQQHDRAFGVTTPIWDFVFGTMPEKNRKTIEVKKGK